MSESHRPPVFLSSLWRSGSTYVWSRFRADPATCCFYEPLHDGLARLTRRGIARDTAPKVAGLHHPQLDAPYFAEYAPLLRPFGGVRRFSPDLAHDRWALRPAEPHPRLGRYLDGLIARARAQRRQPVLGCVRAMTRLGWIGRHRLDAKLIHIDRAPLDVWRSCRRQGQGGRPFFPSWINVVERNADHPLIAPLAERLARAVAAPTGLRTRLQKSKHRHRTLAAALPPEETYFLMAYLWAAAALHGLTHAHAVIDINRGGERGYNAAIGETVQAVCRSEVEFDGLRVVAPATIEAPRDRLGLEAEAMMLLRRHAPPDLFDAARVRARLDDLAPGKATLLRIALDEGLGRVRRWRPVLVG